MRKKVKSADKPEVRRVDLSSCWTDIERSAWKLPSTRDVLAWSEANVFLESGSNAIPGYIDIAGMTPYLVEPFKCLTDKRVTEISLMFASQVGKSTFANCALLYHSAEDPAPCLFVSPTKDDSDAYVGGKIEPLILSSPAIRKHLRGGKRSITKMSVRFKRNILKFANSGSISKLKSSSVKIAICDEVDEYDESFMGQREDPIACAQARLTSFRDRKMIRTSTPKTKRKYIYPAFVEGSAEKYHVPCPKCGGYQVLKFENLEYPQGVQVKEMRKQGLVKYRCAHCEHLIDERYKGEMVKKGVWVPRHHEILPDGSIVHRKTGEVYDGDEPHRSFWLNALYSPFDGVSWPNIVDKWLKAQGKINKLQEFRNQILAEPFEIPAKKMTAGQIAGLRDATLRPGLVPADVLFLTAGVDVHDSKTHAKRAPFYMVVRGWTATEKSYLIAAQTFDTFEKIDAVLSKPFATVDGRKLYCRLAGVDAGYKPHKTFAMCRKRPTLYYPTKGYDSLRGSEMFRVSRPEKDSISGKALPNSVIMYLLNTILIKNTVASLIDRGMYLHYADVHSQYEDHMRAEQRVIEKNKYGVEVERWVRSGENHFWDAECIARGMAEILGVSAMPADQQVVAPVDPAPQPPQAPSPGVGFGDLGIDLTTFGFSVR